MQNARRKMMPRKQKRMTAANRISRAGSGTGHDRNAMSVVDFRSKLQEVFNHEDIKDDRDVWTNVVEHICAFGPRRVGPKSPLIQPARIPANAF